MRNINLYMIFLLVLTGCATIDEYQADWQKEDGKNILYSVSPEYHCRMEIGLVDKGGCYFFMRGEHWLIVPVKTSPDYWCTRLHEEKHAEIGDPNHEQYEGRCI